MADPSFSFSDLDGLMADLTEVPDLINGKVEQSVQQTAMRTKKSWAADAAKSMPGSIASQYAPTIDYEARTFGGFGQGVFAADIGPNLGRYGGKTGKGGLLPSMGILDDPQGGSIKTTPSRSRRRAEKFAETELVKGVEIAIAQSLKKLGA